MSEIQNKLRACRNAMKLWGHFQCNILDVHAKILAGNYFPNARLPPLPFLLKKQLHAYRRKVKINRGLVETIRNFGDTLNVLFEMSMQKKKQEIIFLWRVCLRFCFWQKRNCTRTV